MKILIALFMIVIFFFCYYLIFDRKKDAIVYLIPLLIYFTFNIAIEDTVYRIVGEDLKNYITMTTIIFIGVVIFLWNKKMFHPNIFSFFFLILTVNILWSYFIDKNIQSVPMFLRLVLNYVTIYLAMLISITAKESSLNKYLRSFNILAILNGILGILQFITGKKLILGEMDGSILYTEGAVDANRAVGIAGSNNSGGNLAALLFVIVLYNFFKKKDLLSLLAVIFTGLFALLTQTRVALLAIALAILFQFFSWKSIKKTDFYKKIIVIIGLSIIFIMGFYSYFDKIVETLILNRGNTAGERFNQFSRAWDFAMKDHFWTGIGSGQWRSFLYNNYGIVDIPIHSQYLNFWVENGFPVFIANILFNFILLFKCLKNKYLQKQEKKMLLSLFFVNLVVCNFNPNQIYTINLAVYYLTMFLGCYSQEILNKEANGNKKLYAEETISFKKT